MSKWEKASPRLIPIAALLLLWGSVARPVAAGMIVGSSFALVGLGIRGWACGYLQKNQRLCRSGPYRWLRHPLYLGSFLIGNGLLIAATDPSRPGLALPAATALAWLLFFVWYLPRKERREASRLERAFGADFVAYRAELPSFVPRTRPLAPPRDGPNWRLSCFLANSEAGVAIAVLVAFLYLALRLGR